MIRQICGLWISRKEVETEWLVIWTDDDGELSVGYCESKTTALETVRNILEGGETPLDKIEIFEAKRKKVVIDIEGETE
jgi:hypothetical protein